MEIYLLEQDLNNEYDTYDSAVVIAENEDEARKIHPSSFVTHITNDKWMGTLTGGPNIGGEYEERSNDWVRFDQIKQIMVTHIGKANEEQKKGVLLASFNAG